MSDDCAFSKSNPFKQYQVDENYTGESAEGIVIYNVSITVTGGTLNDKLVLTFTSLTGKAAGSFSGIMIPSSLDSGTYSGKAAFADNIASYVGQQIIALAAQAGGLNTINFATPTAVIGSVTSANLTVSCSGGLFSATAAS